MPALSNAKIRNAGDAYRVVGDWTPGAYVTGGVTITAADCGLPSTANLEFLTVESVVGARLYSAIRQTDGSYKVLAYTAINTQVTNATDLAVTLRVRAEGGPGTV
jgi:hypothetical protein